MEHSGYILEFRPEHPRCSRYGYLQQHRLVAELILGRMLSVAEVVHHEDEDKANNDPGNLWLFPSQSAHLRHHKRKSPRYDPTLAMRLRPLAADPSVSLETAAAALDVSLPVVRALCRNGMIPWISAATRVLTEEQVHEALQGRSLADAASLLGVDHKTLRRRFPQLLTTRASPGFLDARKEEIRNLARSTRADALALRYGCNPETVKNAIRRWSKEEPGAWSDVSAFQQSRLGIQWSRARKA